MMSPAHLKILADLIRWHRPHVVLEWGGGASTWYLSSVLAEVVPGGEWHVVETSARWRDRIVSRCGPNTEMLFYDCKSLPDDDDEEHQAALGRMCAQEYIEAVRLVPRPDLVIVDGRHRARCIQASRRVLMPGALIVLHDADRPHYQQAMRGLDITIHRVSDGVETSELWVGGVV